MDSKRLKQIEEIYHAALEIPHGKRDSFFKEHCGEDLELRREVESLLLFEKTFDSLIDAPPKSLAAEIFSQKSKTDLAGNQINQYKILSLLGEGGMGAVYLAQDTTLERKVAIKFLSNELSEDSNRRNRFFQEAKSASALNHPNILTVHEIGEVNGTHFIVTEFIKGRTLIRYLTEEKSSLQSVLEIATQIASALSAAHKAGIIHRDIKPENVMVRDDGIVKVLDFGLAKLTDSFNSEEIDKEAPTQVKPMTIPGMILGTPQYMSPEQARGQRVDLRSDIFSFGVVLYEMITGKPPFSGATNMDIIGSILKDEPKPLSEHQPHISHHLEHIVSKALRKDREQRYQHIKDLFIDLNDIKKTIELNAKLIHNTDPAKAVRTLQTTTGIVTERRFSLIHALVFLLAASGIIVTAWWLFAPSGGNQTEQLKTAEVVSWRSSPGEVYSAGSFSPDSKVVAFASTKVGTKNIWIKQTSSGEAFPITKDEFRNDSPIWSPNGEEIAFFSLRGNQNGIWRMPYLTGAPTLIKTLASEDGSVKLKLWSKKEIIYYESNQNLFTLDVRTRQTSKLTDLDSSVNFNTISVSPDEVNIGYVTADKDERWSVWVTPLRGGTAKQIVSTLSEIKNTVWHPDNKRIFYSSNVEGIYQIFVTDINGSKPRQLSFGDKDSFVLDVSSDGTKILYGSTKEESDVWGVNVAKAEEFSFTDDISSELWASVSPDNKTVAFQSIKNLSQGDNLTNGTITTKQLDSKEQPFQIVANGFLPMWSPDGKQLAFMRVSGERYNLWTVKANGGDEKQLTTSGLPSVEFSLLPYNRTQQSNFSWSPDSKKIIYISNKSGQRNLWLVSANGSDDTQLTNNNDANLFINCPLWSSDGKHISYTTKPDNASADGKTLYSLWVTDAETKTSKAIFQSESFLRLIGWSQTEKELIIATIKNKVGTGFPTEIALISINTETGKQSAITNLQSAYLYNIHLSADRNVIAFASTKDGKDNVWVMPSIGGVAKRITNNSDSRLYFSSLSWSPDGRFIFFGKQSRFSLLSMITNFK